MGGSGNPYVAELRPGAWRVVVPRRGKLFPAVLAPVFESEKAAAEWLSSSEGQATAIASQPPFPKSGIGNLGRRLARPV